MTFLKAPPTKPNAFTIEEPVLTVVLTIDSPVFLNAVVALPKNPSGDVSTSGASGGLGPKDRVVSGAAGREISGAGARVATAGMTTVGSGGSLSDTSSASAGAVATVTGSASSLAAGSAVLVT